ncbi:MAG TPA: Hpt domain-containing protein, partial [Candidatus Brocadiia bacterium]|nr:Hpt domain-containing protein [Candidatus Brocadiia bacterium]
MADKAILQRIEDLAAAVVMADSHDAKAVEAISAELEAVGQWARENGPADLAEIVAAARENMRQALAKGGDFGPALLLAGQVVSGLQSVVRDSKPLPEAPFPVSVRGGEGAEKAATAPAGQMPFTLPPTVDEKIFSEFLARQGGVLDDMEALVLALEKAGDDTKLKELRRLVHTLKGEGALLGLSDVEQLCHASEELLGSRPSGAKIDALLGVADWLRKTFDAYGGKGQRPAPVSEPLERVTAAAGEKAPEPAAPEPPPTPAPAAGPAPAPAPTPEPAPASAPAAAPALAVDADPALLADFIQESKEHLDNADLHILTLETEPENEEALNAVFRAFHTIKGVAGFLGLDQVRTLAHESESLLDLARKGSLRMEGAVVDVTFDAVDGLRRLVARLSEAMATGQP